MTRPRAEALAAALDLDIGTTGICYACLSFVSFPLDDGEVAYARRQAREMAPILWDEGLEEPARASLERAREAGVRDADIGFEDVERNGGRSIVVQAIVLRLAADLTQRTRTELALEETARPRLPLAPPELN